MSDLPAPATWPSVGLCIPTFRRPSGLRHLLAQLARIDYPGPLAIVVVENDAKQRAGVAVVEEMCDGFAFPLRAVVEARHGQTFAYNRGFAEICRQSAPPDYVAVLDDDEFPDPNWLTELVIVAYATGAEITGGPVYPVFENGGNWLARTGLFEPKRFATGPVDMIYGAGNMMIRRDALVRYLDEPFSAAFAFTGGSDLEFFTRCRADGLRFAWADDACVFETTPPSRTTVTWLVKRHFRKGSERTRIERASSGTVAARLLRWYKGIGLLVFGLASLPVALCRGPRALVKSLLSFAAGAGRLAAEFDIHYEEYRYH